MALLPQSRTLHHTLQPPEFVGQQTIYKTTPPESLSTNTGSIPKFEQSDLVSRCSTLVDLNDLLPCVMNDSCIEAPSIDLRRNSTMDCNHLLKHDDEISFDDESDTVPNEVVQFVSESCQRIQGEFSACSRTSPPSFDDIGHDRHLRSLHLPILRTPPIISPKFSDDLRPPSLSPETLMDDSDDAYFSASERVKETETSMIKLSSPSIDLPHATPMMLFDDLAYSVSKDVGSNSSFNSSLSTDESAYSSQGAPSFSTDPLNRSQLPLVFNECRSDVFNTNQISIHSPPVQDESHLLFEQSAFNTSNKIERPSSPLPPFCEGKCFNHPFGVPRLPSFSICEGVMHSSSTMAISSTDKYPPLSHCNIERPLFLMSSPSHLNDCPVSASTGKRAPDSNSSLAELPKTLSFPSPFAKNTLCTSPVEYCHIDHSRITQFSADHHQRTGELTTTSQPCSGPMSKLPCQIPSAHHSLPFHRSNSDFRSNSVSSEHDHYMNSTVSVASRSQIIQSNATVAVDAVASQYSTCTSFTLASTVQPTCQPTTASLVLLPNKPFTVTSNAVNQYLTVASTSATTNPGFLLANQMLLRSFMKHEFPTNGTTPTVTLNGVLYCSTGGMPNKTQPDMSNVVLIPSFSQSAFPNVSQHLGSLSNLDYNLTQNSGVKFLSLCRPASAIGSPVLLTHPSVLTQSAFNFPVTLVPNLTGFLVPCCLPITTVLSSSPLAPSAPLANAMVPSCPVIQSHSASTTTSQEVTFAAVSSTTISASDVTSLSPKVFVEGKYDGPSKCEPFMSTEKQPVPLPSAENLLAIRPGTTAFPSVTTTLTNLTLDTKPPSRDTALTAGLSVTQSITATNRSSRGSVSPSCTRRRHQCPYCPKSCERKDNLQAHIRTHTGERPYPCRFCPKAFPQKDHLRAHIRTHTGEKPYRCPQCMKAFAQLGNLHRHAKTHRR